MKKQISGRRATDICLANHLLQAFNNTDPGTPGLSSFLARPNAPERGQYGKLIYSQSESPQQIRREIGSSINYPIPLPIMTFFRLPGHEPCTEGGFCVINQSTFLAGQDQQFVNILTDPRIDCSVNFIILNYQVQFFADNMDAIDSWTDLMAFYLMSQRRDRKTRETVGTGLNFEIPYELTIPQELSGNGYYYYYVHGEILTDEGRLRGLPFDPITLDEKDIGFNFGVSLDLRVKTAVIMGENARVNDSLITELGKVSVRKY